jgi:hypothetical protein
LINDRYSRRTQDSRMQEFWTSSARIELLLNKYKIQETKIQ